MLERRRQIGRREKRAVEHATSDAKCRATATNGTLSWPFKMTSAGGGFSVSDEEGNFSKLPTISWNPPEIS